MVQRTTRQGLSFINVVSLMNSWGLGNHPKIIRKRQNEMWGVDLGGLWEVLGPAEQR